MPLVLILLLLLSQLPTASRPFPQPTDPSDPQGTRLLSLLARRLLRPKKLHSGLLYHPFFTANAKGSSPGDSLFGS